MPERAQHAQHGEVAEWSNAAVLKTVGGQPSGGSNPSLSAINCGSDHVSRLWRYHGPAANRIRVEEIFGIRTVTPAVLIIQSMALDYYHRTVSHSILEVRGRRAFPPVAP